MSTAAELRFAVRAHRHEHLALERLLVLASAGPAILAANDYYLKIRKLCFT